MAVGFADPVSVRKAISQGREVLNSFRRYHCRESKVDSTNMAMIWRANLLFLARLSDNKTT